MSAPQKKAPYSVDDFDSSHLQTERNTENHPISQLSQGVYKITSNGHEFVARIPVLNKKFQQDSGDPHREVFLGSLLEKMPVPFLAESRLLNVADSRKVVLAIQNYWGHLKQISPDVQISIVPLHKGKPGNNFLHPAGIETASVKEIFEKVPEKIRIQLSNYWAIYTVFRIVDFHEANWIMAEDHQTVIPIDFAWRYNPKQKVQNNILALDKQQQPFGTYQSNHAATQDHRNMMLQDISPSLKRFFREMNLETLKMLADKNQYKLSNKEAQDILAAAYYIGSL